MGLSDTPQAAPRTEAEWRALLVERVQIAMDLGRAAGRAEAASLVPPPTDNLTIGEDGRYHCGGCDAHDQ